MKYRYKRIFTLLLLLFVFSFWWAGGDSLLTKTSIFLKEKIPTSLPTVAKVDAQPTSEPSAWDRLIRVIDLKTAVTKKLDKNHYVKLSDLPVSLQQAVIAVEDSRFYRHYGFDIEGILRASLVNLQTGQFTEGGSTITQQLAKNLFLSHDKTVLRKIEEVILSLDLELRYSKEEILEMYLNSIYFGSGCYGIQTASATYFQKLPGDLTLAESSLLAGIPNAPSLYSPFADLEASRQRQAIVLSAMVRNGFIGPGTAKEAQQLPLRLAKKDS